MTRLTFLSLMSLVGLTACQETNLPPAQTEPAARPPSQLETRANPVLEIVAPAADAVLVASDPVSLRYRFQALPPGSHVNAYIDGKLIIMLDKTEGDHPVGKLSPGAHTLTVDLRDAQDKPLGISRSTNFSIGNAKKVVSILSPSDGAIHKSDTPLTFGYEFTPRTEGDHVHAFLDGKLIIMLYKLQGTHTLPGVMPGQHNIKIDLRNASHEALGPQDSIDITVVNPL